MERIEDKAIEVGLRLYGALGLLVEDGEGVAHEGSTGCMTLTLVQGSTVADMLERLAEAHPRTRAIAEGEYAIIVLVEGKSVGPTRYGETILSDKTMVQLLEIYAGG
ncbi:MAG: MoaD/ThiS family protein [Eggerthellaceae bacterium]|nr:MoaD/ThiS family protein [Eggerthellaceae bacterium]